MFRKHDHHWHLKTLREFPSSSRCRAVPGSPRGARGIKYQQKGRVRDADKSILISIFHRGAEQDAAAPRANRVHR